MGGRKGEFMEQDIDDMIYGDAGTVHSDRFCAFVK